MASRWVDLPKTKPAPYGGNCVYVIYIDGSPHYVGQTNSLYMRMLGHAKRSGWRFGDAGVRIKVSFNKRYGEHAMRELRLIARLKPAGNKLHRMGRLKPWTKTAHWARARSRVITSSPAGTPHAAVAVRLASRNLLPRYALLASPIGGLVALAELVDLLRVEVASFLFAQFPMIHFRAEHGAVGLGLRNSGSLDIVHIRRGNAAKNQQQDNEITHNSPFVGVGAGQHTAPLFLSETGRKRAQRIFAKDCDR
jgi:hypothetical protein